MQGNSGISKDLPPFTMALRVNEICGLNSVGLRRAGFTIEQRLELKRLYHRLFRSGKNLRAVLGEAREIFPAPRQKFCWILWPARNAGFARIWDAGPSKAKRNR